MDFPDLITDRTQSDVDNGTEKGFYNASDLNRVNDALRYLDDTLTQYGISSGFVEVRIERDATDLDPYTWYESDIPNQTELDEYLRNVLRIRSSVEVFDTTPQLPDTFSGLTYSKANDIEKILFDVENIISRIPLSWFRSGEIYSGEA